MFARIALGIVGGVMCGTCALLLMLTRAGVPLALTIGNTIVRVGATPTPLPQAPAIAQEAPQATIAYNLSNDRERFAYDLLTRMGNPQPTPAIIAFVVEWTLAEDGGNGALARNNPLNTTMCGYNQVGAINGDGACGVGHYATYDDGIAATIATLQQSNFAAIAAALLANDPDAARVALWQSPWAASHYNDGAGWPHYQMAVQQPTGYKCGYTDTMAYQDGFNAVAGVWSGQYGSMHLGVDFTGNYGDPVYQGPWEVYIEDVTSYPAGDIRAGVFVQGRYPDGTLFYAGHLIDAAVQEGQTYPPCTLMGRMGATSFSHSHIKLGAPNAPVPCEGSPPGDRGCIDPIAYWEGH